MKRRVIIDTNIIFKALRSQYSKDDVLKNGLRQKGFDNFFDDTIYE